MSSHQTVFPAATRADWEAMATKVLRGAAIETLTRHDEDNLPVQALYPVEVEASCQVGKIIAPGGAVADRLTYGWDVAQPIWVSNNPAAIDQTNRIILDALESGATAVILWLEQGASAHFAQLFDQVTLSAISLHLCGEEDGVVAYDALLRHALSSGLAANMLRVTLGSDVVARGVADQKITSVLQAFGDALPRHIFDLSGLAWHHRGATAAAEIGLILAGAAALLRAAPDPAVLARHLSATIGLSADILAGMAKVRALRLGWAGLLDAFGLNPEDYPLFITAMPGLRMFTLLDEDTNMLRITTALLAGALGGADRMASWGHNVLSGESDAARRFARMSQLLLIEESGIGRSLDVAAGAPALEARTDALAQAGWSVMQAIEVAGGITNEAAWDEIDQMVLNDATTRAARFAAIAGDESNRMVGVTWQPAAAPPAILNPAMASYWAGLQRPAARVEALRQGALDQARRIVILRPTDSDSERDTRAAERQITSWLAIAGLTAVGLQDNAVAALETARPDVVIVLEGASIPDGYDGIVMDAAAINAAEDQLSGLEQIANGTVTSIKDGEGHNG